MNKNKLVSVMKLHGDTQENLAKELKLSLSRINAKINSTNGAEFTMGELQKIRALYQLTADEMMEIFFCG